jgi:protein-S-isoprenylcysteine O-methyltransferase Ste14
MPSQNAQLRSIRRLLLAVLFGLGLAVAMAADAAIAARGYGTSVPSVGRLAGLLLAVLALLFLAASVVTTGGGPDADG